MSHNVERMMYTGRKPWWYGTSAQGSAVGVYVGDVAVNAERADLARAYLRGTAAIMAREAEG